MRPGCVQLIPNFSVFLILHSQSLKATVCLYPRENVVLSQVGVGDGLLGCVFLCVCLRI